MQQPDLTDRERSGEINGPGRLVRRVEYGRDGVIRGKLLLRHRDERLEVIEHMVFPSRRDAERWLHGPN